MQAPRLHCFVEALCRQPIALELGRYLQGKNGRFLPHQTPTRKSFIWNCKKRGDETPRFFHMASTHPHGSNKSRNLPIYLLHFDIIAAIIELFESKSFT
jgi:hypothetical protein